MRSSISLSFLVHAFLVFACLLLISQRPTQIQSPRRIWVELERYRAPVAPVQALPKQENKIQQQIVQTDAGKQTKVPEKDAFLGEKTQVVDRQTVSHDRTTVMGPAARAAKTQAPSEPASVRKPLARFGIPILPALKTPTELMPDQGADARWAEEGTSPQDYVKGISESDHTALNTKEFVFYGYFQRIRERLDRAWVPILRQKLVRFYGAGRQLASDMDHTTKVVVTLNPLGEITKVSIIGESGTRDLDEAAVSAFNQAGPFPNPPKGIVDPNGEIQIPWEFILKT